MRLNIRRLNNYNYYSIIKDYTDVSGKRTTKIFEKLGNQAQVEERFGKDNTIDNIKKYINDLNNEDKEELMKKEYNPNKRISGGIKRQYNVGYLFLKDIYYDLKLNEICDEIQSKYRFKFNLNDILSNLVFSRIIYPASKLKTHELCKKFIEEPNIDLHNIYRGLTYLNKELDFIQQKLFENSLNVLDRNSKVIYFDCTNYYFEIDDEDELRKYGISKEHRPNPIIGMGLFMDGDGIPLAMNIFPGNENETKHLLPTENKIVNQFKLPDSKIILCTDAALSTDEIKKYNIEDGRGFVITQSLKKIKEVDRNKVFEDDGWRIQGDLKHVYKLSDVLENEELYYNTLFYKIIQTETKSVKQDLVVTYSMKYRDYYRDLRNSQILRAKKKIENNPKNKKIDSKKNQNDYNRFITETASTNTGEVAEEYNYILDEELIKEEEKYDGYYALTTNLIDDIGTILKVSKGRWEIEESFRIMKSDFKSRPVELQREDRITAHFLTCYIALMIYRILEKKLNNAYTTSQILECLRNMDMLEQKGLGFEPIYERTNLTDCLHDVFKFNTDYEIVSYKKIKKILKSIL